MSDGAGTLAGLASCCTLVSMAAYTNPSSGRAMNYTPKVETSKMYATCTALQGY